MGYNHKAIDLVLCSIDAQDKTAHRSVVDSLVADNKRLRAELSKKVGELAAMQKQRDEVRREACSFEAIDRWHKANPKGLSPCAVFRIAREIAVERGWDCFAQQEGGGA